MVNPKSIKQYNLFMFLTYFITYLSLYGSIRIHLSKKRNGPCSNRKDKMSEESGLDDDRYLIS